MKNRFIKKLLLIAISLLAPNTLFADGFRIKEGRYDGPVVEMELNHFQKKQLSKHYQSGMNIKLSSSQRAQLRKEALLPVAPTTVSIFYIKELSEECTCGSSNLAFPFKAGWVELPKRFLSSDFEGEQNKIVD